MLFSVCTSYRTRPKSSVVVCPVPEITARTVDAEEARRCGLVRRVVPAGELLEAALDEAEALARCAPDSVAMTKELLWRTSGLPVGLALDLAASANVFARTSPDMKEGLAAFFDKRKPRW